MARVRERLRSKEILLEEEILREQRNDDLNDIDALLERTIQRAEDGLRRITELECEFLDFGEKRRHYCSMNSDEYYSFEEDKLLDLLSASSPAASQTSYTCRAALKKRNNSSDIDSLCDASFQSSGSSDDQGSISHKLPALAAPIPSRNARRTKNTKSLRLKSSASTSSFADSAVGSFNSFQLSPVDTRKELDHLKLRNNGLHRQISDMQMEMNKLQFDIQQTRKSLTCLNRHKSTSTPQNLASSSKQHRPVQQYQRPITFTLKANVDPHLARRSMERLQREIQNLIISGGGPS